MSAIKKLPQTLRLKTLEIYSFTVLETRSLKSSYQQDCAPSRSSRRDSGPSLLQLLVAVLISCLRVAHTNLCLHLCMTFSSVSVTPPLASLIRILVTGFRAYLGNPGWSHLKILNLITSVKSPFSFLFFFSFFFFGHAHSIWKFLGQGSNPCHSSSLNHRSDKSKSLASCTKRELQYPFSK